MREYRGLTNDPINTPAGKFPKENGWGGECWNFRAWRGRVYGYARVNSSNDPAPSVRRLNSHAVAEQVDDVTVVWVAHNGSMDENYVVGWFEHATVHGRFRDRPDAGKIARDAHAEGVDVEVGQEELQYFVCGKKEDARLLAEGERAFRVPIAKGWMARQSLLFYPDRGASHEKFKARLLDYIAATKSNAGTSTNSSPVPAELLDAPGSIEGQQIRVTHHLRERDAGLVKRAKKRFRKKHGALFCEACKFDSKAKYGPLGEDLIEAHHVKPLTEGTRRASLDDLMMLCPNCHRMVHRMINRERRALTRQESLKVANGGSDDCVADDSLTRQFRLASSTTLPGPRGRRG